MSNEKKTAMQQLISVLNNIGNPSNGDTRLLLTLIKKEAEMLLSLEKQQIVEAYQDGRSDQHSKEPKFYNRNSEYYYSQKYKQ